MNLSPEKKLAQCEVVGSLGAGGIGEVYRARGASFSFAANRIY